MGNTHTQAGFGAARTQVRAALRRHDLRDVVVALEATGTYHRPVQDAFRQAGFETRLVHPFASKHFRQPADPGNKTDDTDLVALFRATVNGFGLVQPTWPDRYLQLQQLGRQRRDLVHKTTILRCQLQETLHQLMPGYTALFAEHFFDTPSALPLARVTGSAQAVLDAGLDGLRRLLPQSLRYRRTTLVKVRDWARTATPAQEPCPRYRQSLDRLADDRTRPAPVLRQRQSPHRSRRPVPVTLPVRSGRWCPRPAAPPRPPPPPRGPLAQRRQPDPPQPPLPGSGRSLPTPGPRPPLDPR